MKKFITITAMMATMFVGVSSASACSDLGFLGAMKKSGTAAQRAMEVGGNGNMLVARQYLRSAQRFYTNSPAPCMRKLKTVNYQYGMALDYVGRGFDSYFAGNVYRATTQLSTGVAWLERANNSLN